jgi:nitrous oxidase accessory protein NosD
MSPGAKKEDGMATARKVLVSLSVLLLWGGMAWAAGSKPPPAAVGPQTLAGFGGAAGAHEFILQAGSSWKGDLTGIGAGPTWSLVILDIDATGVTGPANRFIYFNLQDADSGSHFKNLGINFYLDATGCAGGACLQAYQQWTWEGMSSHGLNPGVLTTSDFDLRFDFTKAATGAGWTITPYFRLAAGTWTLFFGGSFVATVGGIDFDAGKLIVAFDGGADGTLSFSNYYLAGPPSTTYVDDDWAGTSNGDAVQFPSEAEYRTIGVDAFDSIQDGIDAVAGSTVNVAAGTYPERLTINKSLDLRGAQFGVDPTPVSARTTPADESIVDTSGLGGPTPHVTVEIPNMVHDITIAGFTLIGDPTGVSDTSVIRFGGSAGARDNDRVTIKENILDGRQVVLYRGGDDLTIESNRFTANKNGVVVQAGPVGGLEIIGNTFAPGASLEGDPSAIQMTAIDDGVIRDNTAAGFTGGRGLGGSNLDNLEISGNSFTGGKDSISIFGGSTFIDILDNELSDNTRHGINIKGADITITGNDIIGNGERGVNIDRHVIDTERVTVSCNNIVDNATFGVKAANASDTIIAENNWWGDASGPYHPTSNPAGSGDEVSDGVDFDPFLTETVGEVCPPPRTVKESIRDALSALLTSGDDKTDRRIGKAIDRIDQSLDPELWVGDSTLSEKGKKVFSREKQAVHELMKIDYEPTATQVAPLILDLVVADEVLAQAALGEATSACTAVDPDSKHLQKAQEKMDKAEEKLLEGRPDKAIYEYGKAWDHAQKALRKCSE